jgi:NADH-quinone oxidoreductase subunit N
MGGMTATDLVAIAPLILLGATAVTALLGVAYRRDQGWTVGICAAGYLAAILALGLAAPRAPREVTPLLYVDSYGLFFLGLLSSAGLASLALSQGYFSFRGARSEEFYLLLTLALFGGAILVLSRHFASLFLGLEILSVSLYAMISYPRHEGPRVEAAVKYLILAGSASAFLLFGIALVYLQTGSLSFPDFGSADGSKALGHSLLAFAGLGLLSVGLAFKLGLAPFHMWTPDVYQGAPAPVTGFVATVSKGAVFALALRYFNALGFRDTPELLGAFTAIAVTSMLLGNLMALLQTNVKRLLAYSSIAHMGYLMVPFVAAGPLAPVAAAFYLLAYFATTLIAFGVITALTQEGQEPEGMDFYHGLFWRRPWMALLFGAALLSLTGLPPMAGLIGKIYLTAAGVETAAWIAVGGLVVGSVIGVFYYMRLGIALFRSPQGPEGTRPPLALSGPGRAVLALLLLLLLWLGLYPSPVLGFIQRLIPPGSL